MSDDKLIEQAKKLLELQLMHQKSSSDKQLRDRNLQKKTPEPSESVIREAMHAMDNRDSSAEGAQANEASAGKKSRKSTSKLRQPTKFSKVAMAEYAEVQIQTVGR